MPADVLPQGNRRSSIIGSMRLYDDMSSTNNAKGRLFLIMAIEKGMLSVSRLILVLRTRAVIATNTVMRYDSVCAPINHSILKVSLVMSPHSNMLQNTIISTLSNTDKILSVLKSKSPEKLERRYSISELRN